MASVTSPGKTGRRWCVSYCTRATLLGFGLLLLWSTPAAVGAPGDLDPAFGASGTSLGGIGGAGAMTLQSDGSIIVGGGRVFRRYLSNGKPDRGFGRNGRVSISADPAFGASDIAADSKGRLVVVGRRSDGGSVSVVRLLPDGGIDQSYGAGGSFVAAVSSTNAPSVEVDSADRAVVLVGDRIFRLASSGAADTSFGVGGTQLLPTGFDAGNGLGLLDDGRILVVSQQSTANGSRGWLLRYLPDGSLDPSYGDGGSGMRGLSYGSYGPLAVNGSGVSYLGSVSCGLGATAGSPCNLNVTKILPSGFNDVNFGPYQGAIQLFTVFDDLLIDDRERLLVLDQAGTSLDLRNRVGTRDTFALRRFTAAGDEERYVGYSRAFFGRESWGNPEQAMLDQQGRVVAVGTVSGGNRQALARFLTSAKGKNRDADGFSNKNDRCPIRTASRHSGCPTVRRTLTVDRSSDSVIQGSISSRARPFVQPHYLDPCAIDTPIELWRHEAGGSRLVRSTRTDRTSGSWHFRGVRGSTYSVRVDSNFARGLGYCLGVHSRSIRAR